MTFLKAEWRDLILLNYAIPPESVEPWLPADCEIDLENGLTYASLVFFEFQNTRVLGVKWPWHVNFSEINLRLYVRRKTDTGWRRGVVFVKELVPRPLIAWTARVFYREPYEAVPIRRDVSASTEGEAMARRLDYYWGRNPEYHLRVLSRDRWGPIAEGSHEEFILEHYWGYNRISGTRTNEYEVVHPRWKISPARVEKLHLDFAQQYGKAWDFLNGMVPFSTFVAQGSEVRVEALNRLVSAPL